MAHWFLRPQLAGTKVRTARCDAYQYIQDLGGERWVSSHEVIRAGLALGDTVPVYNPKPP